MVILPSSELIAYLKAELMAAKNQTNLQSLCHWGKGGGGGTIFNLHHHYLTKLKIILVSIKNS